MKDHLVPFQIRPNPPDAPLFPQTREVLELVRLYPGLTSAELAEVRPHGSLAQMGTKQRRAAIARRLTDLRDDLGVLRNVYGRPTRQDQWAGRPLWPLRWVIHPERYEALKSEGRLTDRPPHEERATLQAGIPEHGRGAQADPRPSPG
jgi:hypothetical protein